VIGPLGYSGGCHDNLIQLELITSNWKSSGAICGPGNVYNIKIVICAKQSCYYWKLKRFINLLLSI